MSHQPRRLGVIGGSGLYDLPLEDREECVVSTPFGEPSDSIVTGRLGETSLAFLARHGRGHRVLPTDINYRANIYALKSLGVRQIVSSSAVGSLKQEIEPLHVVIPDQFIDRTRHRVDTFFGQGVVAHVSLADPFCAALSARVTVSAKSSGAVVHESGTYVCMEGPQFSTRAESELYRSWGADVIGMTNLTEARLAREAEICYATMAWVTDYDCWKLDEEAVTVDAVIQRLQSNADKGRHAVEHLATSGPLGDCPCHNVLDGALITPAEAIDDVSKERLGIILQRALS